MKAARVHLPVVPGGEEPPSSLRADGRRARVVPADVHGRFTRARAIVRAVLLAIAFVIPLVRIEGRPAIFLDVAGRRFFVFGSAFNAQDAWLAFFALTALGFALVVTTTLLGRAWCGWACPQTVLLEGLFRPIERWLEGPRNVRLRRDAQPPSLERTARKALKHVLFFALSALFAHVILAYFVSLPSLGEMILEGPSAHPEAFAWVAGGTLLLYGDVAWFREQLCLIVCPYGRLQSVLTDDDSLVVGYDERRGEPRGHRRKGDASARGDCVDCGRCVVVCPTGIDIRRGLQVDCIACSQCIDACDEVMDRLGKPLGLVRYDSLRGLRGEARRWLRPRLALYAVLAAAGALALALAASVHAPFEANLLRTVGAPYAHDGDRIRNVLELHLVNKRDRAVTLAVEVTARPDGAEVVIAPDRVELAPLASRRIPVVVRVAPDALAPGARIELRIRGEPDDDPRTVSAPVLGPIRRSR